MKKSVQMVGLFISFLLMAISCQNENLIEQSQGSQFTLSARKGIASRTHLVGNQTVWSEGDQIYVSSANGRVTGVLTLSSDPGEVTGTFTGLVSGNPNDLAYSVFPAPKNGTIIDLSIIEGAGEVDAPMIGKINHDPDAETNVQFENICGVVPIVMNGYQGEKITLKATNNNIGVKFASKLDVRNVNLTTLKPSVIFEENDLTESITINDAKGGQMYIPYYLKSTLDNSIKTVVFKYDDKTVNEADLSDGFVGKIHASTIIAHTLKEDGNSVVNKSTQSTIETIEGKTTAVVSKNEFSSINENGEETQYYNVSAIVTNQQNQVVPVEAVKMELPKVTQENKSAEICITNVTPDMTITIKEEDSQENNSIKRLTVVLPSGTTEEEAKEQVVINMPNTTVTIKSADGHILLINYMEASTAPKTLVIEKNVSIKNLNLQKGSLQVFGHIDHLTVSGNKDNILDIIIEVGGSIGKITGNGSYNLVDKNKDKEFVTIPNPQLSQFLLDELGSDKVTINAETKYAEMKKSDVLALEGVFIDNFDEDENDYTINSLVGIENFINLTQLICSGTELEECDLSKNTKLETICVNNNNLKVLDFSHNPLLEVINCSHNENLTELNLTNCENLYNIHVHNTALEAIDIPNPEKIETFMFGYTKLDINLEPFTALTSLGCEGRYIGKLQIPDNMKERLTTLFCNDNQLSEFDLGNYPNLCWFRCDNNNLTELDLAKAPNICDLRCSGNQIPTLDLTPLITAAELYCGNQQDGMTLVLKLTDSQKETWYRIWYEHNENVVLYEEPKVLFLPTGSEISTALANIIKENSAITKIKFIADSDITSETLLVTDANGMKGYLVINGEWLEIHTSASKFIANEYSGSMFYKQDESESPNFPVSYFRYITEIDFGDNFDTSNVMLMGEMFYRCTSLTTVDVSGFNTSNVLGMEYMFSECRALKTVDVSNFDTSNVGSFFRMFYQCDVLESIDVSGFNTSEAVATSGMFAWCPLLESLDVSNFDTSNVTDMSYMFYKCDNVAELNVSRFNTSEVTNMSGMFGWCTSIKTLDLSNFNTTNVTSMENMFYSCNQLTSLDLGNFDTSKVTDMDFMFEQCKNLKTLNISSFNTSNVTSMQTMFCMCSSLEALDVSGFDTSKVTMMNGMFLHCSSLTSIDIKNFNTSNVTLMSNMFGYCENLRTIDLSNFDLSKATSLGGMFEECYNLTELDLTEFSFKNNPTYQLIFYLTGKKSGAINPISIKVTEEGYNYLTSKDDSSESGLEYYNYAKYVKPDGTDW